MLIPMSPTDSMFLLAESENRQMQVGGLALFTPPEGACASDVRQMFATAVARDKVTGMWRKRARRSVLSLGQWGWDSDADVDLDRHVHYSALPRPAGMLELWTLVSWLHATPLDRDRPLWEMHLIEGLADGRYAVYIKVHHALTDGVSAMGMLRAALSADPELRGQPALWEPVETASEPAAAASSGGWLPGRAATAIWDGAWDAAGLLPALGGTLVQALRQRGGALSLVTPDTMFNVAIDGARSFTGGSWPLERLRLVAKHSDATVNDVVLAMCAGALRSYLTGRSALPLASLVAMIPVSLRLPRPSTGSAGSDDTAGTGNKIGSLMCGLATDLADSGERLLSVRDNMREGKATLGAHSQLQILAMSALGATPLALGMLLGHHRLLRPPNVMISNVTGSPVPLYWNGARLDALYPLSIPVDGQALNITCTSTDDTIAFGLTGCRDAVPGMGTLTGLLDDELRLLEHAAGL